MAILVWSLKLARAFILFSSRSIISSRDNPAKVDFIFGASFFGNPATTMRPMIPRKKPPQNPSLMFLALAMGFEIANQIR